MRVFLSHSSNNKSIALELQTLIEECGEDVVVFCSSDKGAIPVGRDFVKCISDNLENCDVFIPLLTTDYFQSKFCMIELGFAVAYLLKQPDDIAKAFIYPFCVYPVSPGNALDGTPISHLQVSDLLNKKQLTKMVREVIQNRTPITSRIDEFIHEITKIVIKEENLLAHASRIFSCAGSFYDHTKNWDDCSQTSFSTSDQKITTTITLNPYELTKPEKPDFISTVIQYVDSIDLSRYLKVLPKPTFKFTVNNITKSLTGINVELKYGDNKQILFEPAAFNIGKEKTECSFDLSKYRSKKLGQICEICFVINKSNIVEDEGTFTIENIRIE